MTGASDSGGWSRHFGFDQYGNMALTENSGVPLYGTTPMIQNGVSPFNPANNQLLSGTYDQAGNQTQNGSLNLYYDGEAHQVTSYDSISGIITNYYYDDQGRRVINQTINGPTTVYVYDALGQKVADYSTAASSSPCQTCYMTYDHLGSTRVVTDQNGSVMGIHDYLPFGEEIPAGWAGRGSQFGAFDNVAQKFTGKDRDWQSGLDYFGARYYGSALGRFTSPDEPFADQNEYDPQSWNLYSYVRNNPVRNLDENGRACISARGPNGETITNDLDGKGCAALHDNTVHGDEPGLLMLARIGETFTNPHNVAQFVSDAGRAAASLVAPQASAAAECIMPGGSCNNTNLAMAMLPFGLSKLPHWAETAGGFVNYLKNFEGKIALTAEEADTVIAKAKELGVDVRLDPPHPGTNWDKAHLNVGKNGQVHLEVPMGYDHPGVQTGSATRPKP